MKMVSVREVREFPSMMSPYGVAWDVILTYKDQVIVDVTTFSDTSLQFMTTWKAVDCLRTTHVREVAEHFYALMLSREEMELDDAIDMLNNGIPTDCD